jgi:hypothetical protein
MTCPSSKCAETRVVNCRKEAYDTYVGRPSIWGCPFAVGHVADRPTVIRMYREWILNQPHLLKLLPTLKGKRLGCWCKPKACHGDVLVELINLLEVPDHENR